VHATGSADNDLGAVLESLHVIADAGATDAGVALDLHEVTDGDDDLLDLLSQLASGREDQRLALLEVGIDLLKDRDREGGGLASAGLGLGNDVVACLLLAFFMVRRHTRDKPLMTGMMARCWMAEGRSKP
jgi:hypothetical protein